VSGGGLWWVVVGGGGWWMAVAVGWASGWCLVGGCVWWRVAGGWWLVGWRWIVVGSGNVRNGKGHLCFPQAHAYHVCVCYMKRAVHAAC
jgi:hypothetical protein